jgi:hypothetical protein
MCVASHTLCSLLNIRTRVYAPKCIYIYIYICLQKTRVNNVKYISNQKFNPTYFQTNQMNGFHYP